MTLEEIRRNKGPQKENYYPDMEETATATANSSRAIPKMSFVSDCLPLKQTENDLRNVGDGKIFQVSESNRNENDCFDHTNQIISDMESKPSIRQRKRKNTDPASGPPTKRPRLVLQTYVTLQNSKLTPQVNGCSHLSRLNGKSYLNSGESGCFGLGQPVTDIPKDTFKSCSVLLMNKTSSISFNTAACGAAQSTLLTGICNTSVHVST
jgi:hypothetical protein